MIPFFIIIDKCFSYYEGIKEAGKIIKHNIYFEYLSKTPYKQRLDLIKQAGFDGIFLKIDKNDNNLEIVEYAREIGLDIEAMHLSATNCNSLWEDTEIGRQYVETIITGIKETSALGIPIVIMHISSGNNPPPIKKVALEKIREILAVCKKYDVILALENLRRLDYLDYIFDNINDPYLRFCFDSGHAHAFTKNIATFPYAKYKDLLVCIHLSDNDGSDDHHQLPFDGTIQWEKVMNDLEKIGFRSPLTLEAYAKNKNVNEIEYLKKSKSCLNRLTTYLK